MAVINPSSSSSQNQSLYLATDSFFEISRYLSHGEQDEAKRKKHNEIDTRRFRIWRPYESGESGRRRRRR
jgi:hypothetical protein